jgi:hypothetical protein
MEKKNRDVSETGATDDSAVNNNSRSTNINYTNHSFGPLYVSEGTDCLRHDTEYLGGCPDAACFGLNVVDVGEKRRSTTIRVPIRRHPRRLLRRSRRGRPPTNCTL